MPLYDDVRRAFLSDLKASLGIFGVHVEKEGAWWQVRCPMPDCKDQSGSAGIDSKTGYLRCHQCGAAHELFSWLAVLQPAPTVWDVCLALADTFHVPRPKGKKPSQKNGITDVFLAEAEAQLWGTPNPFQKHLAERELTQEELVPFRLALCDRGLLFVSWDEAGRVNERAHCWGGPHAQPRWIWWPSKRTSTPLGIWPAWIPPADAEQELWLFEGEWDVLIARTKLGLAAYTWTGGSGAALHADRLPAFFKNRRLNICYDLDVFAGPGVAVPKTGMRAQHTLLRKSAPMLEEKLGCRVAIRAVPLDPAKHPKGDIRDWWMETRGVDGMVSFPIWTPAEAWKDPNDAVVQVEMSTLGVVDHRQVSFLATASAVSDEAMVVHDVLTVDCPMGSVPACSQCRLFGSYPDGVVPVKEEKLWGALYYSTDLQRNMERYLHPGRACPGLSVRETYEPNPAVSRLAYAWWLCPPLDEDHPNTIPALSWLRPAIATNLQMTGRLVGHPQSRSMMVVEAISEPREQTYDCSPYADELRHVTPWNTDDPELIWRYLNMRQEDLQANVTGIFGVDWALAFDLLIHSALELPGGERGWIDAAFCGYTRSGKTETARRLCDHYGLPPNYVTSVQGNVSRSGLTTTVEKLQGNEHKQWRARPGLFPRRDARMVVLDEFHHMTPASKGQRSGHNELINELQSVRDRGFLDVEKAAHARFRSRVRLLTISNPPRRNGFASYRYPCMVIRDLYGTDEAISRLDWLFMSTNDENVKAARHTAPITYTKRLCTILRQRAWFTKASQIHYLDGVEDMARTIGEEWQMQFVSSLPLYTRREKWRSILRVATAIALLRFSHLEDPNHCIVNLGDVQVARDWFEMTFESSHFDCYSLAELQAPQADVNGIEACLMLKVHKAEDRAKLSHLYGPLTRNMVAERLGFAANDRPGVESWMSMMLAIGGLEQSSDHQYSLSQAAKDVIAAIERTSFSPNRSETLRRTYFRESGEFAPEPLRPLPGLERWG